MVRLNIWLCGRMMKTVSPIRTRGSHRRASMAASGCWWISKISAIHTCPRRRASASPRRARHTCRQARQRARQRARSAAKRRHSVQEQEGAHGAQEQDEEKHERQDEGQDEGQDDDGQTEAAQDDGQDAQRQRGYTLRHNGGAVDASGKGFDRQAGQVIVLRTYLICHDNRNMS